MITERQNKIIEFLKDKEWVTQWEIYINLKDFYKLPIGKNFHDTRTRWNITQDIRSINESDAKYVILSSSIGVKLANEKEAEILIKKQIKTILSSLNLQKRKLNKIHKLYGEENDGNNN